jgi:hypothetical protein
MTNTELRTNRILESLSPTKYVLFYIAQALNFDSDTEWFSASGGNDSERSAETDRVHSAFMMKIHKRYPPSVASQKIRDAFLRSQFLRRLWCDCNLYVDEMIQGMRPRVRLLDEQQMRALLELRYQKSTAYIADPETLLADLLQTRFTIDTIRSVQFENRPILFKQYAEELDRLVAAAEDAAETHNKLHELECAMGGQRRLFRVDGAKVKLAATKDSDTLVDSLVCKAQSRAHADFSRDKQATELLISALKGK